MRPLKRAAHVRLPLRHPMRLLATTADSPSPATGPVGSLLIANRGEIALRIHRTATRMGIPTTTLYTAVDATAQHARASPRSLALGSYLDGDKIIALALQHGIQALHPGYGFLSENAAFAERCAAAGITFVGPPAQAMADMGDKARSKAIMLAAGVPCVPGYHGPDQAPEQLAVHAAKVGYPVLLKSVRGGGGKGMRIVQTPDEFEAQLRSARAEARASFGDGGEVMLVERYIVRPRHVEVQVFADKHGTAVALGERDCSIQRRHQKILEESPAPDLGDDLRHDLWDRARTAALAVGYVGAGTVEFILDRDTGEFFFMEMNTRLQVEHPVSELVTGTDLVEWQLRVAAGEPLPLMQDAIEKRIRDRGHAIEARIYAENPERDFMPDSGCLVHLATPAVQPVGTNNEEADVRIDAGFVQGDTVSEAYDGMIAKLIVRGADRKQAIRKLELALEEYEVAGLHTNIEFLKRLCRSPAFVAGDVETGFIDKWRDELLAPRAVADETYVQAALALFVAARPGGLACSLHGQPLGFGDAGGGGTAERSFAFEVVDAYSDRAGDVVEVALTQTGWQRFRARVWWRDNKSGSVTYDDVLLDSSAVEHRQADTTATTTTTRLTAFYPTTRATSTVVQQQLQQQAEDIGPVQLTVFQGGTKTELKLAPPAWYAKVRGTDESAGLSVVAPMPCKILRNEVCVGETVEKGAPLVVIESMKMETVIRSPQQGIVKKLAHKEGDICKAGTVLVLFEEAEEAEEAK
ncbi:3-methylcrotonyl-carboxylase subunit alpha [Grosmannia clavigera kw1407]|uniref:3-methylcrotonyl-carboxylase subunit alpha n=1 Tax=Grosmannia clavigera (strain kw1407 / UAMH 11150) TaxID=655863 RepID=F0XJ98_GROCL|nr:3-methylcrotonyl-carboxylase subunit alpha [Grosmannia clavigera kw1407]EFX02201.1 3-methylcrotonyl-carboxylase subunit alpha [Grosmannia clavigera kw1407]